MSKLKKGKSWCATCENREKGRGDSTDCRDNSVMERPFYHQYKKKGLVKKLAGGGK